MPLKEREESIPSLLTDAYLTLRVSSGAANRER
jgi:hypothetical protein